jgi:transposase
MKRRALRGCEDRPRPGRRPRVVEETAARLVACAGLERDRVVAFRAIDAQRILKEEFDRDCDLSSTYRLLHRINLRWLAPRPRHPEADATAQTAFSQLCNYNYTAFRYLPE